MHFEILESEEFIQSKYIKGKKLINKVLIVIVFSLSLNAAVETSSSLTKQKMEVLELKNELNNFYNEKEKSIKDKKELEDILTKIEQEKAEIKRLYEKMMRY